jgi:predicted regulator of Ras-like GTPase activity (Roadblock/LC7/MglB family)
MTDLKDVLNGMLKTQGVNTAVVVGRDGFVIDGVSVRGRIDSDVLGAVMSTGIGTAEVMGGELKIGAMTQSMFEYKDGVIVLSPVGEAILAVVADAKANLGMIRYRIKKDSAQIAAAL